LADLLKQVKERIKTSTQGMHPNYIVRDENGSIEAICCRACGTQIQGWVEDRVQDVRTTGNIQRVVVKTKFRRLNNYTQVRYKLSNGSLYEPPICRGCAPKMGLEHGEKLFACHLDKMVKTGNMDLIEQQGELKVVEFLGIKEGV